MRFVDTNVLLYAVSTAEDEAKKASIALELLEDPDLALSAQVLQEFYVQATRPTKPDALSAKQAEDLVLAFARFPVQSTDAELVTAAIRAQQRFQLSYWDAAIVEAARRIGCRQLLTEDLNHGQDFEGVEAVNPFSTL